MIGNDIVDLAQAALDSNWRRERYLDRLFTAEEQALILNASNPHQTVWKLWSIKEASYKVYVQETGHRFFNPKKLRCEVMSPTEGLVTIFDRVYNTTSEITEHFIHSIAFAEAENDGLKASFKLKVKDAVSQSMAVRMELIRTISETQSIPKNHLQVQTNATGIPQLYIEGKPYAQSLSLSHHGAYGAFAMS